MGPTRKGRGERGRGRETETEDATVPLNPWIQPHPKPGHFSSFLSHTCLTSFIQPAGVGVLPRATKQVMDTVSKKQPSPLCMGDKTETARPLQTPRRQVRDPRPHPGGSRPVPRPPLSLLPAGFLRCCNESPQTWLRTTEVSSFTDLEVGSRETR